MYNTLQFSTRLLLVSCYKKISAASEQKLVFNLRDILHEIFYYILDPDSNNLTFLECSCLTAKVVDDVSVVVNLDDVLKFHVGDDGHSVRKSLSKF